MSSVKHANHAAYDLRYHFVWVPKYRKIILQGPGADSLKEIFQGIAEHYELEIDTLDVMPDHIHLFLLAPPKYSPSKKAKFFKSVSAQELFHDHPELREELWGG
jgi:putative transposase